VQVTQKKNKKNRNDAENNTVVATADGKKEISV